MNIKKFITPLLILLVAGAGIAGLLLQRNNLQPTNILNSQTDQLQVAVSILPQKQIVKEIGGERVAVEALIPPGFSPATFEPTVTEVKYISNADVYFRIGEIGFEKTNLDEIEDLNSNLKIVDTSANNQFRHIEAHHHAGEEDEHHEDEHEGEDHAEEMEESQIDPHVWLAPHMVKQQAEIITQTLVELDPDHQAEFEQNFAELAQKLDALDQELATAFAPIKGQTILVYHPAFGYLADEYGFTQEHIEIEGKEPSIKDLQAIIDRARMEGVKVIFVQKQFSQDSAKAIAQNIGGQVVQVNPLEENYLENIKSIAASFTQK
jgi:zinc transport system substrate-binding protein